MTTLMVVDGYHPNEARTQAIARRLRSELASINLKGAAAARRAGVTQAWMSRRLNGTVSFAVDELDMICDKLGLPFDYIVTGIRAIDTPGGPPPTGGGQRANPSLLLPRMDSNHQPSDCLLIRFPTSTDSKNESAA